MNNKILTLLLLALPATVIAQGRSADYELQRLEDLAPCLQVRTAERCLASLDAYVGSHPEQAYPAGKAVRLHFRHWAALRFFDRALQGEQADQVCADEDFALAMLAALELPADHAEQQMARALLPGRCFTDVLPVIEGALQQSSASSYLVNAACPTLQQHGRVPPACRSGGAQDGAAVAAAVVETLPELDPAAQDVVGPVTVLGGPEGAVLQFAALQAEGLYLVKLSGAGGDWEGRVLLHREDSRGLQGSSLWTEHQGQRFVTVVRRDRRGYPSYVVSLPGRNSAVYRYLHDDSKAASARLLLDEWRRQSR